MTVAVVVAAVVVAAAVVVVVVVVEEVVVVVEQCPRRQIAPDRQGPPRSEPWSVLHSVLHSVPHWPCLTVEQCQWLSHQETAGMHCHHP